MNKYIISYPNTGRFLKGVCSLGFVWTDDKTDAKTFNSLNEATAYTKCNNIEYNDDEFDDCYIIESA